MLEPRYQTIREMYDSGARVVASSDAGSTATRIDEFALLLEFLVNRLEIPAAQVITSATSLAADAIGLGNETGSLEPGKKADVILLEPVSKGPKHAFACYKAKAANIVKLEV